MIYSTTTVMVLQKKIWRFYFCRISRIFRGQALIVPQLLCPAYFKRQPYTFRRYLTDGLLAGPVVRSKNSSLINFLIQ